MKTRNLTKYISLLCLLAILAQLLCACGEKQPTETPADTTATTEITTTATEAEVNEALLPLTENGKAIYRVIRPEMPTKATLDTALALLAYIKEASGVNHDIDTDWVRRGGDPDAMSEYEILVGETNRTASSTAMGELTGDTWCVTMVGNRIVINASSGFLLDDAIEYFKSICITVNGVLMLDTSKCKVEVLPNVLIDADLTLRVGSYNIKNGNDVNHDMSIIAEDIKALDLDIVGLQEVDIKTSRAKGLDTLKLLAEATGYEYYQFAKGISFQGGEYGTAILSRYPIVDYERVALTTPSGYEARAFGHARIEVNGVEIDFFNTHLSYEKKELRDAQFAQLAEHTNIGRGYIVTGDFNTANLTEFNVFTDAVLVNKGNYATFPSSSSAIDNIVLESGWKVVDSGMVATKHSDHNLLWAEIHYEG